jgi:hypothetical protein
VRDLVIKVGSEALLGGNGGVMIPQESEGGVPSSVTLDWSLKSRETT